MFFREENWDTEEICKVIPASSALSFEKMESSLQAADDLFLTPLLGEELMQHAHDWMEENPGVAVHEMLLTLLRRAEANLALWYNFTELQLRLTDQGWQRQTTENFAGPYKYQEDQLRNGFKNKGMNALDMALDYLEKHTEAFPEYKESPAYQDVSRRWVRSTREVDDVWFINGSRLVFLRLLPVMREVETVSLPSVLGQRLYDHVVEVFGSSTPVTSIGDTTIEELRLRCVRYIVAKSVAQLVRQTGSLTDRGLYFENVEKAGESGDSMTAAGQQRAAALAAQAEASAVQYMTQLQNFIALHIADMFGGRESDVLKRDNEHKHSVWL